MVVGHVELPKRTACVDCGKRTEWYVTLRVPARAMVFKSHSAWLCDSCMRHTHGKRAPFVRWLVVDCGPFGMSSSSQAVKTHAPQISSEALSSTAR